MYFCSINCHPIFDNVVKDHLKDYNVKNRSVSTYQVERWRKQIKHKEFNDYIGHLLDDYKITLPNRRRAFDYHLWFENRTDK